MRSCSIGPTTKPMRSSTRERLLQALEQLPPSSGALLKRRSQDDVSLEQAGEELGMNPAAARAAASRAYKKLRELLHGDED